MRFPWTNPELRLAAWPPPATAGDVAANADARLQHEHRWFADPTGQMTVREWVTTACHCKPRTAHPSLCPLGCSAGPQLTRARHREPYGCYRRSTYTGGLDLANNAAGPTGLPIDTRITLLTANIHASTAATKIIESVCSIIGTSVAPASGIFGACLRDALTIGGHGAVNGYKLETAAQMRFGFLQDSFAI